ncbi:MAG: hypothetical protein FJ320_04675 [SAR202 cluster bacterium]|nr:hypothetical protein [SAR202 cluster bacterium]
MYSDDFVRRHRLSGLANGVLIGMGLTFVLYVEEVGLIGLVGLFAGVGLEIWQRRRIPKSKDNDPSNKQG